MHEPLFNRIDQVGVTVYNVDKQIQYYEKFFGKDIFEVIEGTSMRIFEDGRQEPIQAKAAFAKLGNLQIELIEIKEGNTIHLDWLKKHGEGIHHMGMFVEDFQASLKKFQEAGVKVLQMGKGRMYYAYMDTKPFCLEIIEKLPATHSSLS